MKTGHGIDNTMAEDRKRRSLVFPLVVLLIGSMYFGLMVALADNSDDAHMGQALLLALFAAWFVWVAWRWSQPS